MQELIKAQVDQFEAIADAMQGQAGEESVKPKTHKRAGITKNHGHGEGKKRRRMAAASRRRNRAA
jgi:hypothetical protein